jgi:hypothetical protein
MNIGLSPSAGFEAWAPANAFAWQGRGECVRGDDGLLQTMLTDDALVRARDECRLGESAREGDQRTFP